MIISSGGFLTAVSMGNTLCPRDPCLTVNIDVLARRWKVHTARGSRRALNPFTRYPKGTEARRQQSGFGSRYQRKACMKGEQDMVKVRRKMNPLPNSKRLTQNASQLTPPPLLFPFFPAPHLTTTTPSNQATTPINRIAINATPRKPTRTLSTRQPRGRPLPKLPPRHIPWIRILSYAVQLPICLL